MRRLARAGEYPNSLPRPPGELEELEAHLGAAARAGGSITARQQHTCRRLLRRHGVPVLHPRRHPRAADAAAARACRSNTFLGQEAYNQIFTMHGTVMMFLFAVPVVEATGRAAAAADARRARPAVSAALAPSRIWAYFVGGSASSARLFFDLAPSGGWFMYPPLTNAEYSPGRRCRLLAARHRLHRDLGHRRRGRDHRRRAAHARAGHDARSKMPIFAWAMLVFAGMIVFAFPAVILATMLLELERAFGWPFFTAARGGDPLLWQHLFWFFGHPEVYIIFLPAAGMVSMIVPTMARTPLVGYRLIVVALDRHRLLQLRPVGAPHVHHRHAGDVARAFSPPRAWRSPIPSGIQVFCVDRHHRGGPRRGFTTPMLFVLGLPVHLRGRRPDRRDGRDGAVRLAGARHLFRRRAPPLRADRRHGVPAVRRLLLLGADASAAGRCRSARALGVRPDVRRLQRRLLPDAHHRPRRHAAARLHLSRRARLGARSTSSRPSAPS